MHIIDKQDAQPIFNIAIVVSRFNQSITQALYEGASKQLTARGFTEDHVTTVWVPGAVEIPLTVQQLARSKRYAAIVTLGAVIRGETTHYDYVCDQVSQGCQQVALNHHLPVIFGVITTENAEQAWARVGGDKGHKGCDAIDAACEMVAVMEALS